MTDEEYEKLEKEIEEAWDVYEKLQQKHELESGQRHQWFR